MSGVGDFGCDGSRNWRELFHLKAVRRREGGREGGREE